MIGLDKCIRVVCVGELRTLFKQSENYNCQKQFWGKVAIPGGLPRIRFRSRLSDVSLDDFR